MSTISPTSSSTSTPSSKNALTGFAALTSQDFMTMLLAELKNQDPTQPVSNSDLLQQLSQMQSLQSNVELNSTLSGFANNQQIASGTSLLGKAVLGTDSNNKQVGGIVSSVFVQNGSVMLGIGSGSMPLSNLTAVESAATATGGTS
ncbi:MAG TPA: flagellar hook capping FlgD N-terminal domain-containing protein [Planctomycetaceae bacterium]|jgi:flagellar basal-body rod modification protein FlgD